MSALRENSGSTDTETSEVTSEYATLSDALMVLQGRIDRYQQAKRGSAVVGATEGKLVSKPKTDPSDPITECLVSYGSQIADYADRLYAGQDIPTGLQFTRAVKTFQQVNEEWDMHSRVMFDIADLTHVPITLRFMQGDAPLVGAGYSTTFPLELRPREYSVLAAHAAAQERAAA